MKEKTIRGRRVIYEGRGDEANRSWVEYLRYSVDVFDERESLVEVLGRLADLSVAHAAFEAALAKYPGKRQHFGACKLRLRVGGIASVTEPFPEWPRGMHRRTYARLKPCAEALEAG